MATYNAEDCSLSARLTAWFSRDQLRRFRDLSRARGVSQSAVLRRAAELGLRLLVAGLDEGEADGESNSTEGPGVPVGELGDEGEGEAEASSTEGPSVPVGELGDEGEAEGEASSTEGPGANCRCTAATIPPELDRAWLALACDEDPIWKALKETRACEPARAPDLNLISETQRNSVARARAWDSAAQPRVRGGVPAVEVVAAWEAARPAIEARWAAVNVVMGIGGYKRLPRPAILGEALRRRIAHASRSLRTLDDWRAAFAALAEVPPHAVNRLYLWELDRLCRIPLEANEQEALRELPPEDRPVFAERLTAYTTWTAPRRQQPPTEAREVVSEAPRRQQPPTEARGVVGVSSRRSSSRNEWRSTPGILSPAELERQARQAARTEELLARSFAAQSDPKLKEDHRNAMAELQSRQEARRAEEEARRAEEEARRAESEQALATASLARMRALRNKLFGGAKQ